MTRPHRRHLHRTSLLDVPSAEPTANAKPAIIAQILYDQIAVMVG
jgi:hypothetical protein